MLHVSFFRVFRALRAANKQQEAGRQQAASRQAGFFRRRGLSDLPVSATTSYQSAKVVVLGRVDVCQTAFGGGG
jgi:hypothetical protein